MDRGNVIKVVKTDSPASKAGLKPGDQVVVLGGVPIHSFGDVQFALDRAPAKGSIKVEWLRTGKPQAATLELMEGWRRTDYTWRASQRDRVPTLRVSGDDLSVVEKKKLGLAENQTAFRQSMTVHSLARKAGVLPGDVITGLDGHRLSLKESEFKRWVQSNYVVGDRVVINLLREGRPLEIKMTLGQ